jgi:cell division protein FtsB
LGKKTLVTRAAACTRRIGLIIALALLAATTGCGEASPTREELVEQTIRLDGQLAEVRSKLEELDVATDQLTAEVARFDSEDWKDVTPAVKKAAEAIEEARDEARTAADMD